MTGRGVGRGDGGPRVLAMGTIALLVVVACAPSVTPPPMLPPVPSAVVQVHATPVKSRQRIVRSSTTYRGPTVPPTTDVCAGQLPDTTDCMFVANVRVTEVTIPWNCYDDFVFSTNEVGRVLRCGEIDVVEFNRGTFHGPHHDGALDVCTATRYHYPPSDPCEWRSVQRIVGPLDRPSMRYRETPVGPSCGALACDGGARLERIP